MTTFNRVAGDTGDTLVAELTGVDSLSSATAVEAHVSRMDIAAATLTASVLSASARTITVALGAWLQNTAVAGEYDLEYEVTFASGAKLTWPEGTPDTLIVRAAVS